MITSLGRSSKQPSCDSGLVSLCSIWRMKLDTNMYSQTSDEGDSLLDVVNTRLTFSEVGVLRKRLFDMFYY